MFIIKLFQKQISKWFCKVFAAWVGLGMGGSIDLGRVDLGSLLRVHSCCVVMGVVYMLKVTVGKGGPYGDEVYEGRTKRAVRRLHKENGKH